MPDPNTPAPPPNLLTLPDGRTLSYATYGDPRGVPVLWCHGSPSSRLEPLLVGDDRIAALGLHVVCPDRPGMGASTPLKGRRIADWPQDALHLARALKWEKFAVLGNSGGAPYAAACAGLIPQHITRAAIISGGWRMDCPEVAALPFMNRAVMFFAKRAPFMLPMMLNMLKNDPDADPARELAKVKKHLPPPDFAAMSQPGRFRTLTLLMNECLRQGPAGAVDDLRLYVRDLGFDLSSVKVPISLFHGDLDRCSPIALARRVATDLPGATLRTFENEAHLSMLCTHFDDAAAALR